MTAHDACFLCGGSFAKHRSTPGREAWTVVRCTGCGLERTDPFPDPDTLDRIYADNYHCHSESRTVYGGLPGWLGSIVSAGRALAHAPYRFRYGGLPEDVAPFGNGNALEIGFGNAQRLLRLRRAGWRVYGIELTEEAVSTAHRLMPDGTFEVSSLETLDLPQESFSYILLYHVVEHISDPVDALRKVRALLRPQGRVVVAVPNASALARKFFRSHWQGYALPEHLFHYESRHLVKLLERSGFQVVSVRPQNYVNSFADSFSTLLPPRLRTPPMHLMLKTVFYPLSVAGLLAGDAAALELVATR